MGRMGQSIIQTILTQDDKANGARLEFFTASDVANHPGVGKECYPATRVTLNASSESVFEQSDVVIDFTPPGNTVVHAKYAEKHGASYIVGTTGLGDEDHQVLDQIGQAVCVVQAGNFSLGVNLMTAFSKKMAAVLGPEWDIEILEMHHKHKVDAPSGTAMMIGEAAAAGRGVNLKETAVKSRDGITGERQVGDIGFATLRGGSVIGEHEIIFASDNERLTLSHRAENRGLFAAGAVRAARWAAEQSKGRFSMMDVLGLSDFGV
ncbi:4-hydroxy-tetrahydrodipicolinate reductase [Kordiimonas sp. SCSIO 12610]|nr:4-hydroxy-tetrahydrodipicolinate reductase [Kordiimonas sp. SCSIO 12610]